MKAPTTSEIISRATAIHGDTYDYSVLRYVNSNTKVEIICKTHGSFQQEVGSHLKGSGCPVCYNEQRSVKKRVVTLAYFTTHASACHNNKYDYSRVSIVPGKYKVEIICPHHGSFIQKVHNHLNGSGCPSCAGLLRKSDADFVADAIRTHGGKYDYSQAHYVNAHRKVTIICRKHGPFTQTPCNHLNGNGCPVCKESQGERIVADALAAMGLKFKRQVRFRKCARKKPLPFDFLVKIRDKVGFLIEFNGEQHYRPCAFRRKATVEEKNAAFADLCMRDSIKQEWSQKYHVPVLRIPYWDKSRIPDLIREFAQSHGYISA